MKSELDKSMMDEDTFWEIVEKSLMGASDQQTQLQLLKSALSQKTIVDILGFELRMEELLQRAHTGHLWCACFIMNRGYGSEDTFHYFKTWIISRGREVYYNALTNPDSLYKQYQSTIEFYDFEVFRYVSSSLFKELTGQDTYQYYPEFFSLFRADPKIKFSWNAAVPDTAKRICPRLFATFLHRNAHFMQQTKGFGKKR